MTDTTIRLRASALAIAALSAVAACDAILPAAGHQIGSTRHRAAGAGPPGLARCPAPPAQLPVSAASLQASAALAARFAAAYQARLPGETPRAWLARLAPMAVPGLRGALARAAATPALWPAGQPVTARTAGVQVRDLAPGSVIFTVRVAETATAASGRSSAAVTGLAVTVVRDGAGWAVYDVEPAGAGNT